MNIIELARRAGVRDDEHRFEFSEYKYLEAFVNLVAAHEREECIKLVHEGTGYPVQIKTLVILQKERKRIADAIRERGTT
jgi:hypothetical protein